jgi:outer membrane protein
MSTNSYRLWMAAVSSMALLGAAAAARAETLADALALAYQANPTLQSQRALQRQTDETYVQARAGFRPTVSVSASSSVFDPARAGANNSLGATLTASQPIFTGGRTSAAIDVAEANILAGRQTLRTVEQTVLQAVIQAYQDVIRDQQIVAIRQQSVTVLGNQLAETQARFEVGLLTRTDVARGEAQLANARALLSTAQSNLQNSRAAYVTAVGQNPGELVAPSPLPGLPATVDDAFTAAEAANPALLRAQIAEQASRYRIAQVRAQRRPTVSANASIGYTGTASPLDLGSRALSAGATVTQPLFVGGSVNSQIRAALEQNNSDRVLIESARRTAVQNTAQAWNQMQAAQNNIVSNQEQVRAATVAFEGAQEQYRVGLSTTLDVLLTQETLRSAQLSLVQSQRDLYVAQATLLNAMGRLDAKSLIQGAPLYDPAEAFDKVRNEGSVPWEHVIESLDDAGSPAPADPNRPLPAPAAAQGGVALNPATTLPAASAGFSTVTPTAPIAGTTSAASPATAGARPGAPGDLPPPPPAPAARP